jgi:hypothetical protein
MHDHETCEGYGDNTDRQSASPSANDSTSELLIHSDDDSVTLPSLAMVDCLVYQEMGCLVLC